MNINIEHIRAETEAYHQRFCKKWKDIYGSDFLQDTLRAKHWAQVGMSHAAHNNIEEYTNRIRYIKSLIGQ